MTFGEAIRGLPLLRARPNIEITVETPRMLVLEADKRERRKQMDFLWQGVKPALMNGEMTLDEAISGLGMMSSEHRRKIMSSFRSRMKTEEVRVFAQDIQEEENCWNGLYENMRGSGVSPMKAARQIYSARLKVVNSLQQNIPEGDRTSQKLEKTADYVSQAEKGIAYEMRDEYKKKVQDHGPRTNKLAEFESANIAPDKANTFLGDAKDVLDGIYDPSGIWVEAGRQDKRWLGIGALATIAAFTYAATQLRGVEHGTFLEQASRNFGLIGLGSLPTALMVAAKSYFDRIRR